MDEHKDSLAELCHARYGKDVVGPDVVCLCIFLIGVVAGLVGVLVRIDKWIIPIRPLRIERVEVKNG